MKFRIKELRKSLGMNQEQFGQKIGITKASVSRIEKGINNITEQVTLSIIREFNVNESWLRYGEGEMLRRFEYNDYAAVATKIGISDPDAREAIMLYWQLSEDEKKIFWKIVKKFIKPN